MFSYNRVHIIGYQTQPVDVRQTPGGSSVTDLNLVVPCTYKTEDGKEMKGKSFHPVTLWGPMADIAGQYVRPGSQLFVSGRLQTDTWEDQKTGEKRSKTRIVALDLIMLDPKDGQTKVPDGASAQLTNCANRADVIGNLTREPELRTTTNGNKVTTLGIATNERWKDKASGETKERAEFHNVVVWGDLAEEMSKTLKKGQRIYASGRIQTRGWETPSGAKRTSTEIIAENVSMLGVESSVAQETVQAEAARGPRTQSSSEEAPPVESSSDTAKAPEAQYASEVKAEDLPF
ncbi:MAG: single-stranded DNA-binding protein [Candidatus Peribacteraceae bacterium]|jgi:single-strand DNA-binding protein|nr:single-stranded DNA-binding protein [Candidatus Peribacteraceae bacterium]